MTYGSKSAAGAFAQTIFMLHVECCCHNSSLCQHNMICQIGLDHTIAKAWPAPACCCAAKCAGASAETSHLEPENGAKALLGILPSIPTLGRRALLEHSGSIGVLVASGDD